MGLLRCAPGFQVANKVHAAGAFNNIGTQQTAEGVYSTDWEDVLNYVDDKQLIRFGWVVRNSSGTALSFGRVRGQFDVELYCGTKLAFEVPFEGAMGTMGNGPARQISYSEPGATQHSPSRRAHLALASKSNTDLLRSLLHKAPLQPAGRRANPPGPPPEQSWVPPGPCPICPDGVRTIGSCVMPDFEGPHLHEFTEWDWFLLNWQYGCATSRKIWRLKINGFHWPSFSSLDDLDPGELVNLVEWPDWSWLDSPPATWPKEVLTQLNDMCEVQHNLGALTSTRLTGTCAYFNPDAVNFSSCEFRSWCTTFECDDTLGDCECHTCWKFANPYCVVNGLGFCHHTSYHYDPASKRCRGMVVCNEGVLPVEQERPRC